MNLIKNDVMSYEKRRVLFFSMIAYLLFIGLFLVGASYKTAATFVKTSDYKRDIANFKSVHLYNSKDQKDLSGYMADTKAKILNYAAKLESIEKILSGYVDMSSLVKGLSVPLPAGSYVDSLNFSAAANVLEFDIITPEIQGQDPLNTNKLISAWKSNGRLMSCIKDIESTSSSKQRRGAGPVFVSKFLCSLSDKGA